MKILVDSPKDAAAITGGCTFEAGLGWWTSSNQPDARRLGTVFSGDRDALYIPTLQKDGVPVSEAEINRFKTLAIEMGFVHISAAAGMWILSETGEAQVEHIWICWSKKVSVEVRAQMPALADEIKFATNQDAVAWESGGCLHFTA